jgi:predicted NAD/FAD-binding protein
MSRRRVAVVGAGVSGLTAAYVLQREADVTLFEAEPRLGGHAHTHELADSRGDTQRVDTGFIVHNERTYPNLIRLFRELGVKTQQSEMSMSISCRECGLEYAGALGLSGIFPTAGNLVRGRFLRLLVDVPRFHRQARTVLAAPGDDLETLDAFLDRGRFTTYFRTHFVAPLVSCVWSCGPDVAGQYPARYLFEFLANHGMLSVTGSPAWRTVVGGSQAYVEKAAKNLSAVVTGTPVRAVTRVADGVEIRDDADEVAHFDAAVVATHPDQALALLTVPTREQREVLGAFEYTVNPALLHGDLRVLPRAERARASWNFLMRTCAATASAVEVTYDMNRLQRLDTDDTYLVTLNDRGTIPAAHVLERMTYRHPLFTPASVAAQERLPSLNDGVLAFAGAYHGWGFHEDGCRSGVHAAESLGVTW